MICLLCHEEINNTLYKICSCEDSNVCDPCYRLLNSNKIDKCPICRAELDIQLLNDSKKYYYKIFKNLIYLLCNIFIQLIYPVYLIKTSPSNKLYFHKELFIFMNLINIFFIGPINKYLTLKYFDIYYSDSELTPEELICYYKYARNISILTVSLALFIYDRDEKDIYYFIVIMFIFYLAPLIIYSNILTYEYAIDYHIKNRNKYKSSQIIIKNILNNNSNSNTNLNINI